MERWQTELKSCLAKTLFLFIFTATDASLYMNKQNDGPHRDLILLVSEFEEMKRNGTVGFLEKRTFDKLLNFYEEDNNTDQALEVVEFALEQHGYSEEFYLRKAQLLLHRNQPHLALECCRQASLFAPGEFDVNIIEAEALIKLKRISEAEEKITETRSLCSSREDFSDVYLLEALIWEYREDYKRMFRSLRRALKSNLENDSALERLWVCVEMGQYYEPAALLYRELLDQDPFHAIIWYNLGHVLANTDDFDAAAEAFEFAITADSAFELAYRELIPLYLEYTNQYKRALELSLELSELITADSELLILTGNCYENLGEQEMALVCFREAVRLSPSNDEAHFALGECLFDQEQWVEAIRSFRDAIRINGRKEEYFAAAGEAYFQLGEIAEAEAFFQKATEIAPDQADYWMQLATFYIDTAEPEKAVEVLDEASMYTWGSEFSYCRVVALLQTGVRQQALLHLHVALSESFDSHELLFSMEPELQEDPEVMRIFRMYQGETLG
jgi:tetratricopeptide (TPR) repeat protein